MADRSHDVAEGDADEPNKLLYSDLNDSNSAFGLDSPPLRLDHCDLLLDAMDAQLGQLQVQPQKHEAISREHECSAIAPLRWSQSLSKDTGFESTTQTNDTPMSCLDLIRSPTTEQTSENTTCSWENPATHEYTKKRLDRSTRDQEEIESRREQVIWRLERLLGDTCKEVMGEAHALSDSICTEDFVRCFREEMVESALPKSSMQQLAREEEAERTEISDSDTEQNVHNIERRESSATSGKSSKDTVGAHCLWSNKSGQKKQLQKSLSGRYGVNISHAGTVERYTSPKMLGDDSSVSHRTGVVADHENVQHNSSCSPKAKCLAGVPVWSFDSLSIDSDLDTVSTDQVRQHIHKRPGLRSLIQSVTYKNDDCNDQSDCDTPRQEESEPQPSSVQRLSYGQNRSISVGEAQRNRLVRPVSDSDKDTDEEINNWRSKSERTLETIPSDWTKMKERLSNLRQKCEEEEETLRLKSTQLKDVELRLSELRQKRKKAFQELEHLTAETTQMEKEKRILESVLRDSRIEKESVSCQLQRLQRQRESCHCEVREMEKELAALSQREQTLKDGSSINRNKVIMSVLEKEEMERQLDSAKTQLFAEQRHAREKLESMQEKLEEVREELHRATEAESSLRNRYTSLEEAQMQKKNQIEALQIQVSELQDAVGQCKIRVGTLEEMLAQKEQQLIHLQEQCGVLRAERDGLKGELQHLKTQRNKGLKEAKEQAHRMMVDKQAEEEKAGVLKEQTLSLTQHIESMQSSMQLKEEEVIKLRNSLQQQRKEAKEREEELRVEALEKVHKAVEEERREGEAERMKAVQVHCGILEEQNKKELKSFRSEMQQEKSKARALQHQVVKLKTRVQELESEICEQQKEQEAFLAVFCKSLKEEHQAELQRSQRHMAQQSPRKALHLEQDVQLALKENDRLRGMLEERESSHNQITAEMEQQLRHWAQQLGAECQHLHLLVEQSRAKQCSGESHPGLTVAEALADMRTLRERLKHFVSHLHQELESQRQTNEQLRKDKERELSIQRQQLKVERDQALESPKERLIQEYIEELSSLKMSDGGAEGGGAATPLRKQLEAKDLELRQVERSMAQWKGQTAARLACKFEEELTTELERCKAKLLRGRKATKIREETQRKPERTEGEMMFGAKETPTSVFAPWLHVVDSAVSHSLSDVASLKLLHYLQSKVKQLRVENQMYLWSAPPRDTIPLDSSGSYLTTITQGQNSDGILSQSSIRTVLSEGHETLHCGSECTPVI
ncbi:golgin subfamily A member 6-like protein 25 [Brachyistius frenatus]|uniref:golgin subfamily A member 6-like protein 25 n=1 Tax=Brachyistius frenatus TaxID=100188 RepID=UPI0037E7FFCE